LEQLAAGGWLPIARERLPFPTKVVASRNDPLAGFDKVVQLAECWGAELIDAGEVGHLNPAAGYGPWADALPLIGGLVRERA
jgi:predicted alpha/beta hydrolase family esterase